MWRPHFLPKSECKVTINIWLLQKPTWRFDLPDNKKAAENQRLSQNGYFLLQIKKPTRKADLEPTKSVRKERIEAYFVLAFVEFVGFAVCHFPSEHLAEDR